MYISGCVPYNSKKEKKQIWKELKKEFGDSVKILFQENLITYTVKVNRSLYL